MGVGPERTCVACRTIGLASEMVRLAGPEGAAGPRVDRSAPGRGAWLHPTDACLEALRVSDLARSFRRPATVDYLRSIVAACRAISDPRESDG